MVGIVLSVLSPFLPDPFTNRVSYNNANNNWNYSYRDGNQKFTYHDFYRLFYFFRLFTQY